MARANAAVLAFVNAAVPLFPSMILLTHVQPPGVSVIPAQAAAALLALCGLLAIYAIARLFAPPRDAAPTLRPMLAWLGAGIAAVLLGFDPRAGAVFVGIFSLGILWHLMTLRFYRDAGTARAILWAMTIALAASSLAAIAMLVLRRPLAEYVAGHHRAIGTFVVPGELAGYLIVLLPIAAAVVVTTRNRALRASAALAFVCGIVAFALTFSRAGWIGLASAAAFFVLVRSAARERGVLAAVGIIVGALVVVLLLFNVAHDPSENFTRLSIWNAALQIADRFPLTGIGPFNFERLYAIVRAPDGDAVAFHAHSVYLTFLAETGIAGVAAAAWTWWSFAAELRRRLRGAQPRHAILALAAAAGLAGTLVQGLIDTVSIVIFGLWLPTMAFALAAARDGLGEDA